MKRIIFLAIVALEVLTMSAQPGGAWVRQYSNSTIDEILPITTIKQNEQGVLFFSNKSGDCVQYNGVNWSSAPATDASSEASITVYKKFVKLLGDSVAGIIPCAKAQWIVALQSGVLFKGTSSHLDTFPSAATDYLRYFGVSCGLILKNGHIAIATQQGGIVIIDSASGNILDIISYQSGLDDDRVTALAGDSFGGLWVATAIGVNRVSLDIPVRNFSIYPGLEGIIKDILQNNDTLFVSTTKGVYRLVPTAAVEQVMPYIKREMRHKEQVTYIRSTKEINKLVRISFVNKSDNSQKAISQEIPIKIEIPFDSVINNFGLEFPSMDARRLYAQKNLAYRFEKVTALLGVGNHLLVADSSLLVACSDGLYEIKGQTVHQIVGSESISAVAYLKNKVLVTVGSIGLSSFVKQGKTWQKVTDNITVQGTCSFITSVSDSQIWLSTEKAQYRVSVDTAGAFSNLETFSSVNLNNPVLTNSNPLEVVCNGRGLYRFDAKKTCFVLVKQSAVNSITNQLGYVWLNENNTWQCSPKVDSTQSRLLSLFAPQQLYVNNSVWLTSGGEVCQISSGYTEPKITVFLTSAIDRNGRSVLSDAIQLNKHNNGLTFTWSSNWFVAEGKTMYRYRINGLDSRWSAWSTNPSVTYPFLPAGSYTIELQARNALGSIIDSKPISLDVQGDFFAQYGSYLIVAFLSILCVILFVALQKKNKKQS